MENNTPKIKYTHFEWKFADNGWVDWKCTNCGFVQNLDNGVYPDECPECKLKCLWE